MKFVWQRAAAVAKKEVYHILRDPFALLTALALPVFMVLMFGVAIEFNIKNIDLSVFDSDKSQSSRRLLDTFTSSKYFLAHQAQSPELAVRNLDSENARGALLIPSGFEKDLLAGRSSQIQLLVDGSNSSTVAPILGYVGVIQNIAGSRLTNNTPAPLYDLRTRFLFNPELNSKWFVIPGLNVIVMSMLSILLTALTVAKEWENGSMELLLSTPVEPLEIIVGKLAPYGILGIIAVVFVFIIARTLFHVPFVGNILTFSLASILFLVTYLAQGLLISVVTRNQQLAMQLSQMTGMLPSQLLSGFNTLRCYFQLVGSCRFQGIRF